MNDKRIIRRIYRKQEILSISEKLTSLGNDNKFTTLSFCNTRLFTTLLIFIIVLLVIDKGYLYSTFLYIIYYKGHASQKQASRRGTAPLNLFPRERRRSRGGAGRNLPPSPLFQPEKIFPASLKGFPAPGRISYERASKEMIA